MHDFRRLHQWPEYCSWLTHQKSIKGMSNKDGTHRQLIDIVVRGIVLT